MNIEGKKTIVFADLDGSLLNDNYEYNQIEPIINKLQSLNISIVFNSSKTKDEIDFYRDKWQITDPFIVENGSAIVIPKNYFEKPYKFSRQTQGYNIIELGIAYSTIREKIDVVRNRTGANIVGFGDMTVEEIANDCGLPLGLAQLAKKREYDEPFKVLSGDKEEVIGAITKVGLCYTLGGRYLHAIGCSDKGKATLILKNLYLQQFCRIFSIGVGDSANDLTMLKTVDKPFYVNKTDDKVAIWKEIASITQTQQSTQNQCR